MRKGLLVFGWALVALWAQGCIVICTEEDVSCRSEAVGPQTVTIREIDAVGKLAFDKDRRERYEQIARREGLSERAQIHLVEAVFKRLAFEDAKVDVLLTLVGNPSFTPGAEVVLLDRLDRLAFEHHKRAILDALDE